MCFSASASFGASAVLGVIGIIAVTKAKSGPQRLFAATPLIFAVQQVTEGMLWISLKDQSMESGQSLLTYIYLIFAMAVWPVWVPLSIRLLEKDARSKKLMNVLVCIGAMVASCVVLILSLYPVQVMTPLCLNCPFSSTPSINQHLHYRFSLPPITKGLIGAFSVLYIMATIVTPFISIHKKMKWLGLAFLISYLFAVIFYDGFVISVWCFFAALLSFVVLWILSDINKISQKP